MSVPFSNTTLRIPRGFGNLLEGLSREVLRHQPNDIIEFAAIYFEELLERREATGIDPAKWAEQLEDRFYNNHVFKEIRKEIPEDEVKAPPVTINTAFEEKDITIPANLEGTEGKQGKCIRVPKDFSFISKETISMILEDSFLKSSKHLSSSVVYDTATLTITDLETSPQEGTSTQVYEVASDDGPSEATTPVLIEAAPDDGSSEVTTPVMIEAAPDDGPGEFSALLMIEAAPDDGPSEFTAPRMIEAAPDDGPSETTTPPMTEAVAEERPMEDTSPQMIEAAADEGPGEDTTSQIIEGTPQEGLIIEILPTAGEIEQFQSPEELPVMEKEEDTRNPAEEHAAVVIQSAYRGYSERKKLKEESRNPTEADNDNEEEYPVTDGSEYNSGEELTFAEDENVSFLEAVGVNHEEPTSRLEGNGSTAQLDIAQGNICATELSSLLENFNFNADVDVCAAELQQDTKDDNKSESDMATEEAGKNICGTELDQKDFFEPTTIGAANVDIYGTELEGFVAEKDTDDETKEGTEIAIEPPDELGDEVTEEAVPHYEVGVSGTVENTQDQVDEGPKSTRDIMGKSELIADDNLPTAENQDAEGDSSILE
ncbi:uncharacterized protein LOC144669167 [Cetorhinus maximus]